MAKLSKDSQEDENQSNDTCQVASSFVLLTSQDIDAEGLNQINST